jgi:hypothetical protein
VKYSFRTALKLPGVIFARTAATQKLSTIYMDPVPGLRKFRPEPTKPYVCATYVSISATCPNSCVFKDNGCFAQNGFIRRITRPLDEQVKEAQITGLEVAKNEASLMDRAFAGRWARHHNRIPRDGARGGRDLRLHVGGDVSGSDAVVVLAAAARRWIKRGGGDVWTYTHRWRDIPVELWGPIRVWASTETVAEALEAKSLGYRASMTLDQGFSITRRHNFADRSAKDQVEVIPCPWETRRVPCNRCRLCLRENIPGNPVIGFKVHGNEDSGELAESRAAVRNKRRLAVVG